MIEMDALCPYCEMVNDEVYPDFVDTEDHGDGGTDIAYMECDSCGKKFKIEHYYYVSYSDTLETFKMEDD
jgi:hypothetical protein